MRRIAVFAGALILGVLFPIVAVHAGGQNPTGRAAVLPPMTHGRAAARKPLTWGRAASLPPATTGSATMKGVSADRAARMKGATAGRSAGLKDVSVDRAARMKGEPAPIPSKPLLMGPGLLEPEKGRDAGLMEIAEGKALTAGLSPAAVPGMLSARAHGLADDLISGTDLPVFAYRDGYVLPYEARGLVREGWFRESFHENASRRAGYEKYHAGLVRRFHRAGWGRTRLVVGHGSAYGALNRLDHSGPQWHYRSSTLRRGCLPGRFVGDFYFPLGFYLRPLRHGSMRYNKTRWPILIPWDVCENVAEDFERTLEKSNFPMVIGDMAFKRGNYVQSALAFRDALDRHETATPAGAFAFGDALIALRNYQYAVRSVRAGLEMAPKWADRLDRNGVYGPVALGKKSDLVKHLREVEQFTKDYPKTASGWFLLGYLRMTSGDVGHRGRAAEAFETLLALRPDDALAARYVGLLEAERLEAESEIADPERVASARK